MASPTPPPPGQAAAELLALAVKEGTEHIDEITWFLRWGSFIYTNLYPILMFLSLAMWCFFSLGRACRCIMCTPWLLVTLATLVAVLIVLQICLFPGSVRL